MAMIRLRASLSSNLIFKTLDICVIQQGVAGVLMEASVMLVPGLSVVTARDIEKMEKSRCGTVIFLLYIWPGVMQEDGMHYCPAVMVCFSVQL